MKKVLGGFVMTMLAALALALVRTLTLSPAPAPAPEVSLIPVDESAAAQRLSGAVRIPTVTHNDAAAIDWAQWGRLHAYLREQFPLVHSKLAVETVAQHSLLLTWSGSDASAPPIISLAHLDVVPIEPGTEKQWEHAPFEGAVADGFIWGRGVLDDKVSVMAQLEAVETLLAAGFTPRRTVYFAFGHDEEIGGEEGAKSIAALLASRGVRAEFSLDEGGSITSGIVAGVAKPVASVMTAEKGYLSLRLTTHDAGGHSSRPPAVTAIGRLSRAVARLQEHRLPSRIAPPVTELFDRLAPEMEFPLRLVMANRWLFGPLVEARLGGAPTTNALIRTTTAPTIFHAGMKDNVLPSTAEATVNFRILPGDTIDSVTRQVQAIIDDPTIELAAYEFASDPSPISPTDTPAYAALETAVREVFPEVVVVPGLVIGATDNRHYGEVREARYNFLPVTLTDADLTRIHGANERIAVPDYARAIQFYGQVLRGTAG